MSHFINSWVSILSFPLIAITPHSPVQQYYSETNNHRLKASVDPVFYLPTDFRFMISVENLLAIHQSKTES